MLFGVYYIGVANQFGVEMDDQFQAKSIQAGAVFTPGSPVNERDLFSGRTAQIEKMLGAISQTGYHAVLYGERGVGKTSLANIVGAALRGANGWITLRVNCDGTDDFNSLWRKVFKDVTFTKIQPGIGFRAEDTKNHQSFLDSLPPHLAPDDVRRALQNLASKSQILVIFDEFDRLLKKSVTVSIADLIKSLSDYSVQVTILLIGVAESVDGLIEGHQSAERALVQIPMPRMSKQEIKEIVVNGLKRLEMEITKNALEEVASLSQGLPYITHLLALNTVRETLKAGVLKIDSTFVEKGINASLEQWQQSVVRSYYDATQSSQPGNIYKQVLLACALADTDELGYFTAASVRSPLRKITGKDYDIPNFAQHLKNFSDKGRGEVIERTGEKRRIRYRFTTPLVRPYIVMKGFSDNLITRENMNAISDF